MTRVDFIRELSRKLRKLPKDEIENALNYYNEYFDDAGVGYEDEVNDIFTSPSEVAYQILADYSVKDMDSKPNSTKKGISAIWFVLLAIFAAPLAIPVTVALFAIAASLTIAAITILAALLFTLFMMILSGIMASFSGLVLIFKETATSFVYIGGGITVIGISILTSIPVVYFGNKSLRFIANTANKLLIKAKNRRRDRQ